MTGIDGREHRRLIHARDTINRINSDDRFTADRTTLKLRTFATTTVWVTTVERRGSWARVCEILGLDNWHFWELIRGDAPRYAPPRRPGRDGCAAPKTRGEGTCGRSPQTTFAVTDAQTGEWRMVGFCARHRDYGQQVYRNERNLRAGAVPEPHPNTGGLLPCYINAPWPDLYKQADSRWTPPRVGIRADDWSVMAKVADAEPPALHVVTGGQAQAAAPIPAGEHAAPSLRLVTPEDAR